MKYNLSFDIAALVIYTVVIFFYFWRLHVANLKDKFFCLLMFDALFMTLFDFLGVYYQMKGGTPNSLLWFFNIFYFIFDASIAPIYAVYIFALSGFFQRKEYIGNRAITLIALIVPFVITIFTIILSPFFAAIDKIELSVFYITADGIYKRGGVSFYGIYVVTAYYSLLALMTMLMNRKNFRYGGKFFLIISFFLFSVAGLVIQTIIPTLLVQCFFISISAIIFSYSVKKPEDYLSSSTQLYNRNSVSLILNPQFKKGDFAVIGVMLDDISYLSRSFGVSQLEVLLATVSYELKGMFYREKIFDIASGRFLIAFKNYDEQKIKKSVEEIQSRFSKSWIIGEEDKISLKLYVHLCVIKCPEDADSAEEIINVINFLADESKVKKTLIAVKDLDWSIRRRTTNIEYELRKGIVDNRFQVYYQPIYSVKENMLVGAEALCRLQDDEGNFIPPAEFIPIAEKSGTIFKIGQRVLESVCKMLSTVRNPEDFGIKKIHINLSVCQCMQDIMADMILNTLSAYRIDSRILSLEITENTFDYMPEIFNRNIKRLSDAGIEVVMDDYGIGYSNLNYLLDIPFKMVKIDKSIVWESEKDRNKGIAVASTVSMIKQFGMPVLAEGIETKEQAIRLKSFGCDYLQGFFFGKPVPENEFLNIMGMRYKKFDF